MSGLERPDLSPRTPGTVEGSAGSPEALIEERTGPATAHAMPRWGRRYAAAGPRGGEAALQAAQGIVRSLAIAASKRAAQGKWVGRCSLVRRTKRGKPTGDADEPASEGSRVGVALAQAHAGDPTLLSWAIACPAGPTALAATARAPVRAEPASTR